MSGEPTVLFGVGAAKAATSWLHDYLLGHPDCSFRRVKELHYFDAAESGKWGGQIKRLEGELSRLNARLPEFSNKRADWFARRLADHADWLEVLKARRRDDALYMNYLTARGGGWLATSPPPIPCRLPRRWPAWPLWRAMCALSICSAIRRRACGAMCA
ncbi:MAG: hypothetical protein HZT43_07875 [Exiguobacterium profundum]|nr:MAG: hypothetical protein HZT43_07875 [Exiguobacterium profundum]